MMYSIITNNTSEKVSAMNISYPHTIENCIGEKIIFHGIQKDTNGDKVMVESFVEPASGPFMHIHKLQDEALTIIKGRIGYMIQGQKPRFACEGETVVFRRGIAHQFWNDGEQILHCKGWIQPANTIVFFLSAIFAAQNKSGKAQPDRFDAAYLMKSYASEYEFPEIRRFVKKAVIPAIYYTGLVLGKYKNFKNAPAPIKSN